VTPSRPEPKKLTSNERTLLRGKTKRPPRRFVELQGEGADGTEGGKEIVAEEKKPAFVHPVGLEPYHPAGLNTMGHGRNRPSFG